MAIKISGDTVIDDLKNWIGNPVDIEITSESVTEVYDNRIVDLSTTSKMSKLDRNRAIVAYHGTSTSETGYARILSVSSDGISSGPSVNFEGGTIGYMSITTLDSTKALVTYRDISNSSYGTACVLSVGEDGTTITAGTPVVFESATTTYISVTALDSTRAVVVYRDGSNSSRGTARVLSVSGTTITLGNKVVFANDAIYLNIKAIDSSRAMVAYARAIGPNDGLVRMLSISGTTITAGSEVSVTSNAATDLEIAILDSYTSIISYKDNTNSGYGTARLFSISGTTITFRYALIFLAEAMFGVSLTRIDSSRALITYNKSSQGISRIFTVDASGFSISASSEVVFENSLVSYLSIVDLDTTRVIGTYRAGSAGNSYSLILYPNAPPLSNKYYLTEDSTQGQELRFDNSQTVVLPDTRISTRSFFIKNKGNSRVFIENYNDTIRTFLDTGYTCIAFVENSSTNIWKFFIFKNEGDNSITSFLASVFESASTYWTSVTALDSTKALVTYSDYGNSGYGTACVLSVSGTTITASTPVVFESDSVEYTSVTALSSTKAVVTYKDLGNSSYGTARVLSVGEDGTITVGTPVVFESATTNYTSVTPLDSTKALVAYRDLGNSGYGTACVLSVSGTSITPGTPVVFENSSTEFTSVTALSSTKALVAYRDLGNFSYGTACVLSVSGTTITAGTPVVFESASAPYTSVTALDSTKAVVAYSDSDNSGYGTACVLSVSGTTITASTPVVFESADTDYTSVTALDSTRAVVTYKDSGNFGYGTACVLSVSGTTITPGTPLLFTDSIIEYISVTALDSTKAVVAYRNFTNSGYGAANQLVIGR